MPDFSRMQWQQNRDQGYSYELPKSRVPTRREPGSPLRFLTLPPAFKIASQSLCFAIDVDIAARDGPLESVIDKLQTTETKIKVAEMTETTVTMRQMHPAAGVALRDFATEALKCEETIYHFDPSMFDAQPA
jgi:hypothetical protein